MAQEMVENKVREIVAEQLGIGTDEISRESSFLDDLGADSLDIVELLMALEEEFSLEIPDEDAEKMHTVGDVVSYLNNRSSS